MKIFSPVNLKNASLFTIIHPSHYEQAAFNKKGVYLKLENLTKADEGLYTCLAVSIYMSFAYRSAYVTVKEHEESKLGRKQLKIEEKAKVPTANTIFNIVYRVNVGQFRKVN